MVLPPEKKGITVNTKIFFSFLATKSPFSALHILIKIIFANLDLETIVAGQTKSVSKCPSLVSLSHRLAQVHQSWLEGFSPVQQNRFICKDCILRNSAAKEVMKVVVCSSGIEQ
jgi:hypothetical protein